MSVCSTKGAVSYQPGATPREWNRPTKQRAEGPFQRIEANNGRPFSGRRENGHGLHTTEDGDRDAGATVKKSLTVQTERRQVQTAEESSVVQTARGQGMGRAFSPRAIVSPGFLGRCPRLVWRWAFGPKIQIITAPTNTTPTAWRWAFGPKTQTPTTSSSTRPRVSRWVFGIQKSRHDTPSARQASAPTARPHTSLGRRPRATKPLAAEG